MTALGRFVWEKADLIPVVVKFSEDQARDDHGRWSGSGSPPSDIHEAVMNYLGSGYVSINNSLRSKGDTSIGDHQDQVDLIDKFTNSATLTKSGIVYRLLAAGSQTAKSFASLKPGDVVVDKGYMSVSASEYGIDHLMSVAGVGEGSTRMDISVSKGQHYGPAQNFGFLSEREMLMPRGSRLTYTGKSRDGHYKFSLAKG